MEIGKLVGLLLSLSLILILSLAASARIVGALTAFQKSIDEATKSLSPKSKVDEG